MKKRSLILTALLCVILPVVLRTVYFYRGIYFGNSNIQMPDYETFTISQPSLSTPVPVDYDADAPKTIVLFDQAHTNKYTLAEVDSLRNQLLALGAEVIILEPKGYFSEYLNKADAFVIITPTHYFSYEEIEEIEEFVHRGGRLLVIADPTRSFSEYDTEREDSVILVNEILQPYRLSFRNDYAYNLTHNEGNYRNIFVYPSGRTEITASLTELVFYGAHTLELNIDKILVGEENMLSSLDDSGSELPVAALDNSGNVLVIGDMTFMTNPYYQVADNFHFVQNIAYFLVNGNRSRNLYDFPSLFNQNIAVQLTSGIELDKDLLAVIADIKNQYSQDDLAVLITDQTEPGLDRIILGTYPPDTDLDKEVNDFGILFNHNIPTFTPTPSPTETPDNDEEDVEEAADEDSGQIDEEGLGKYYQVPGIGNIPSKGFGFILLKQEESGNSLYFLADSQENATALLQLLIKGSLDSCLFTDTIAVCEQNDISKSENYEDEKDDFDYSEEALLEEEILDSTITPEESPAPTQTETPQPENND